MAMKRIGLLDPEFSEQVKQMFRPKIIKQVGPFKVVDSDHLKEVLTDDDIEHIKTCTRKYGNFVGAEELFNRLVARHPLWFHKLMGALKEALPEVAGYFCYDFVQLKEQLVMKRSHEVHLREAKGCKSLPDAASRGHIGCIIDLIFNGDVDLNSKNERGETAVYLAAAGGHTDCLEILTQAGCQANLCNEDSESPLYVAAKNGFTQCVEILIEALAKPDVGGDNRYTMYHKLEKPNKHAFTPVWAAAAKGHAECLKLLLDAGAAADFGANNRSDGYTPLMAAVIAGEEKCIQILLEAGAKTYDRDLFGRTPLFIAAMEGKTKCLQILIDAGADINTPSSNGETPLSLAARLLRPDCVNVLLSAGADVHRMSKCGQTALMMVVEGGDEESLKAIIEAGPNLDSQDNNGETALMWAAKSQFDICGQILVENGADIHIRNKMGKTALHFAARKYCLLLTILVDLGADVNAVDNNGETPLMEATKELPLNQAGPYLLEKGADPDKVSSEGLTALIIADTVDPRGSFSKLLREKKSAELPSTKATKLVPASDHKMGDVASCSDVQVMNLWNRSVEVEYCHEPEDTLQQSYSNCQKNPGHVGFIPIIEFGLSHLPDKYCDQKIVDVIKAEAEMTVRLLVKCTSKARPDGYSAWKLRGNKKARRVGSGYIESSMAKFASEDKKKCPCPICEASCDPKLEWGKLEIKTAMHVVYDSSEAKETLVQIFADVDRPKDMHTLYGYDVSYCDQDEDICSMLVATHDLQLWDYIKSMLDHQKQTWKHCKGLAHKLVAIVSHPHGCSKQVTVGEWTERYVWSDPSKCSYIYNVPTCPGSSGAPVIVFGDRDTATDHPHSGSTKQQGVNLSGSGSDTGPLLTIFMGLNVSRNQDIREKRKDLEPLGDKFRPVKWDTLIEPEQKRPESPVQPLYDYQQRPPPQASA